MSSPLINDDDEEDIDMQPTQLYISIGDDRDEDEDDVATQVDPVYVYKLELIGDPELTRRCKKGETLMPDVRDAVPRMDVSKQFGTFAENYFRITRSTNNRICRC